MLKLLQQWNMWPKSIVDSSGVWTVISAFIRNGRVERMTLKSARGRRYRSATPEEIEQITEQR